MQRPEHVGVLAMEAQFPAFFVDQAALERYDGVAAGKYTIGLGQLAMALPGDREDVNALALTAVARLLERFEIDPRGVGRLEVGTETLVDKAKSTKTVLMQLFEPHGNTDIDGATTINACYGATAALLSAVAWVESSAWDGRYAIVVASDIAVYRRGPARPSGGCGAVAMLIGPNAPLALDLSTKTTHSTNIWDFYKPDPTSEYATVDGALSLASYLHAVDECYLGYCAKNEKRLAQLNTPGTWDLSSVDYAVFHSPFNKQVQKSFGRLVYLDAVRARSSSSEGAGISDKYEPLQKWLEKSPNETLFDRDLDLAARSFAKRDYAAKVQPSCSVSQQVGNCYTGSVYVNLATLVHTIGGDLAGKRLLLFSYGSGSIASVFTIHARQTNSKFTLEKMAQVLDFAGKLAQRTELTPEAYTATMALRERTYGTPSGHTSVELTQDITSIAPGAFYLKHVDSKGRREYERRPLEGAEYPSSASSQSLSTAHISSRVHNLSGAVYVSGTSAGIPGLKTLWSSSPFGQEALDAVLEGKNCIEQLSDEMVNAQLDLNIVQLRKSVTGSTDPVHVLRRDQCVQVAAVMPQINLTSSEFALPAAMVCGMDEPTQLAVAAGLKALQNADLVKPEASGTPSWRLSDDHRDGMGIIYATSYPTMQAAVTEATRFYASKMPGEESKGDGYELDRKVLFKLLVLANAQLAQITGARGPNTQVNAACAGASQAIGIAHHWITTGKCERVLVVSSDSASSNELFPWIGGGFRVLGAASIAPTPEQAALPFDVKRNGMIVGAGAIGVVLESPVAYEARMGRSPAQNPRVKLLASHFSNSAYHGASLDPGHIAKELNVLLTRVEREFGVSRADFAAHGVYYSHETGTNASATTSCAFAEVTALRSALGDELLRKLVVANTKGITGHPMAVSFEDVVAVEGLRRGVVPPVVNFSTHDGNLGEGELNLAKGGAHPHKYALRFAAGFGSQLAFTFYSLE